MAILMRHKDSIYGLNPALTQLQTNIAAEQTRATAEEARIEGLVATEQTRATAAEAGLQTAINNEVTRAIAAETGLQTAITAEVTRATNEEAAIRAEAQTESTRIDTAIAAEAAARSAADNSLDARLDNIEAGLVAGVVPMGSFNDYSDLGTLVEANLQHGWAYYINNENDLMMYVSEGTQFDYKPAGFTKGFIKFADYTELSGLVNVETSRALAAESALNSAITAEVNRATAAEATLTTNVTNNTTAISNEVTRATAAEAALDAGKMSKSANLSDLADVAVARTNLDVYSKAETTAAVAASTLRPIIESITVSSGKVTLANTPKEGVNGIMNFATVRHTDNNGVSYDAPVVATANPKEFTVSTDTAGQWDGKTVQVQYLYMPA